MNSPLVSVIMPCYRCAGTIVDAISSVLSQTYENIELVVVLDGADSEVLAECGSFSDSRMSVYVIDKTGASAARNYGFSVSKGDYVSFMDSDDVYDPHKIEMQIRASYSYQAKVLTGSFYEFDDYCVRYLFSQLEDVEYDANKWLNRYFRMEVYYPPLCYLIPRELVIKVNGWSEQLTFNDDTYFMTRVVLASGGLVHINKSVSGYRKGVDGSLSGSMTLDKAGSYLKCLNLIREALATEGSNSSLYEALAFRYAKFIYSIYPEYSSVLSAAEAEYCKLGQPTKRAFGGGVIGKLEHVFGWRFVKQVKRYLKKIQC